MVTGKQAFLECCQDSGHDHRIVTKLRKIDTPMVPIPHFPVSGNDINLVKETKYLGLMIDDNLKWESNVINTQKKISRAIGL